MCSCPLTGRAQGPTHLLPERPEMCPQGSRAASRAVSPGVTSQTFLALKEGFNLPTWCRGLYLYRGAGGTGVAMWKSETGLQAWAHSPWWRLAGVWGPGGSWARKEPHRDKQLPVQLFSRCRIRSSLGHGPISYVTSSPGAQFYSQYSAGGN